MKRKRLISVIAMLAAITALFSLYMIASILVNGSLEQNAYDELNAMVARGREKQNISDTKSQTPEKTSYSSGSPVPEETAYNDGLPGPEETIDIGGSPAAEKAIDNGGSRAPEETFPAAAEPPAADRAEPAMLPEYAGIYNQNSDFFGWLSIPDMSINYPVMHTPDDPQYYLRRAFDRKGAKSGTPFLDADCFEGCGNYIIYGHNMKNGSMFAGLLRFARKEYWEEHKSICFDTLYEHGEYEVLAAFYGKVVSKGSAGFDYYEYTDLTDPAVFEKYVKRVKAAAVYDTGIAAEYGDELITLSTCSYHTNDGRFVVVAKRRS